MKLTARLFNIKARPPGLPSRLSDTSYTQFVSRSILRIRPRLHVAFSPAVIVLFFAAGCLVRAPAHAQAPDSTLNKRFQLAESYMSAGQFERAATLLEDLYRARPDAYVFYDRLKQAYENLKQYPRAIALVEEQLALNRVPVHLAEKARLLYLGGFESEAHEVWNEAIAVNPADPAGYRVVYQSMFRVRLIDEAIAVLEHGRGAVGEGANFHADLGSLYIVNGDYERATEEYVALLQKDEKQLSHVRSRLARLAEEPAALQTALAVTARAVRQQPLVRPLRELVAWLYLETGRYLEALDAFRALDRLGEKDGRALFAFAQQAGGAGAFEAASEAYAELLGRYPDAAIAPEALFGLASMHEQWGRHLGERARSPSGAPHLERAGDTYREFLSRHGGHAFAPNARYQIAHLQWETLGDRRAAEETLHKLIAATPNHPMADEARLDLGMLALERGQTAEARQVFSEIVATVDRSELVERARYQLALAHLYDGDVETALTVAAAVNRNTSMDVANDAIELRVLLQENKGPDSLNTVLRAYGQVLYQQRLGQAEAALDSVDSLLRSHGNHPIADDARFSRAALLYETGALEASWTAFAELPLFHAQSPLGDRALFRAAEILERDLENEDEALKYYTRLLSEYPGSVLAAETRTRIRVLRGDGV